MDTASIIKRLRKQAGWSQEELAERAKISRGHLAKVETGRSEPGEGWLIRVAHALGGDLEVLTGEAPLPSASPAPAPAPPRSPTPADPLSALETEHLYATLIRVAGRFDAEQLRSMLRFAQYVAAPPESGNIMSADTGGSSPVEVTTG